MVVLKFIWKEPMARYQMYGGIGKLLRKAGLSGFQMSYPEKKIILRKKWIFFKKFFAHLLLWMGWSKT